MPNKKGKICENATIYDKKKIYETEIAPLIQNVMKKCVVHGIPFMFQCAVANNEKKTTYNGEVFLTGSSDIVLAHDCFERFLAVMNGFDTHWPGLSMPFEEAQLLVSGKGSDDEFFCPASYVDLEPIDENV